MSDPFTRTTLTGGIEFGGGSARVNFESATGRAHLAGSCGATVASIDSELRRNPTEYIGGHSCVSSPAAQRATACSGATRASSGYDGAARRPLLSRRAGLSSCGLVEPYTVVRPVRRSPHPSSFAESTAGILVWRVTSGLRGGLVLPPAGQGPMRPAREHRWFVAFWRGERIMLLLNNSSGFGKVVFYSIGTSVSDDCEVARSGRRPARLSDGMPQSRDRRRVVELPS